jgi:GNAT superfamily N-acetyltransferase
MPYSFRELAPDDEPIVWRMLYEAARMAEEGATAPDAAKHNPALVKYAENWGRPGDVGFAAFEVTSLRPVGAAWVRLLTREDKGYGYLDDSTPELAMGVVPEHRKNGVGTRLLGLLTESARRNYRSICLNVRDDSPAVKFYERYGFRMVPGSAMTNRVGGRSINMRLMFG